ncbi:MAG: glycosyltransferase family 4 protein [Betaproteobacteria bacterium]|nr:glycosyltransferase family 4 protein [Betaproteobacteria bacterium]
MNILIVSQYFWPENFRVNDLALALRDRGHSVTVLTGTPNYPSGRFFDGHGWFRRSSENWKGVEIRRCPLIARGSGGGLRLALNYASFALFASLLGPWKCPGKFDAIFVHEPSPITVALPALVLRRLRRGPVLLWVLDLWPESVTAAGSVRSPLVLGMIGRLVRFIYRHCDRVLVQSRGFIARVHAQGADPTRVLYFPSWAEAMFTQATQPPRPLPVALPSGFRILFAGNIGAAQDFETILAAAELLRDIKEIHWVVVGDGRMAGWVREQVLARGLTDTVHLTGAFPLETMPPLFAAADALLVTLKADPIFALTIPGKIQSYLACGRPVVGMLDGEGANVLRESGAARVGPSGDAKALATNVMALYQMRGEARQAMGEAGRAYYRQHFERDRLMTQLEQWFNQARDGGSPAN